MHVRLLVIAAAISVAQASLAAKPNIVVFYTDDHGHADLGCQGVLDDVKTPHIDALAASGIRALHGYSTAPQCVPSRAGLMIGKFQSRFGVETNGASLEGFDRELTIAERLKQAGYVTAQFGKWHLGPTPAIVRHGFDHVFAQSGRRPFSANITLDGADRPMSDLDPQLYHVDACSRAATSVIRRYHDRPLFLYIAYRAPHVPLDAPPEYLKRFPGKMPERRRQALAMISATDDGVGSVMRTLKEFELVENTLVFYIGDNGAPLKIHKADEPGGGAGWDGSLNDPLNGEKGMLAEGGMHVPFVVSWPGTIPGNREYEYPVSALDVAATAVAIADVETQESLDGVNLIPYLTGERAGSPHPTLTWRWGAQAAIREGDWKLLRGGSREYLYDLKADLEEKNNLAAKHPEVAERLRAKLTEWCHELDPPGLSTQRMSSVWDNYFDFYLEGKPAPPLRAKFRSSQSGDSAGGWIARKGSLTAKDKTLVFDSEGGFIAKTGLKLAGPVTIELGFKSSAGGRAAVSWRAQGDQDFPRTNRAAFDCDETTEFQVRSIELPESETIIHLRLQLPGKRSSIRYIKVRTADDRQVSLWE